MPLEDDAGDEYDAHASVLLRKRRVIIQMDNNCQSNKVSGELVFQDFKNETFHFPSPRFSGIELHFPVINYTLRSLDFGTSQPNILIENIKQEHNPGF